MPSSVRIGYALVLAAALACYAALGAVLHTVPTYVPHSLGGGALAVGLVVGAPALTAAVLRPWGGRWADRLGPRRVLATGAAVMAVGVLPAFDRSLSALVVSRLVVGAGEALMMSAGVLWLIRLAGPSHRARSLGHIGLANYGGLTAGPLLAGAIAVNRHIDRLWWLTVALPALGGAAALVAQGMAPSPSRRQQPLWQVLRRTARAGTGLLLVNVGYVAVLSFGAIVVVRHGADIGAAVVPVFGVGVIVSRTALGSMADRLDPARVACGAAALEALGLAGFAGSRWTPLTLAALILLSIGQGVAVPALGALAVREVPPAEQGAAAGAFFAWFDGGVGLGGPAVGLVARLTAPPDALFVAAAAVGCVPFFVAWRGVPWRLRRTSRPDGRVDSS